MGYTNGYGDNFSAKEKIPYDDIPISRRAPKKKSQRVSVSSFKVLVSIVAVMFIINIGLCVALMYHVKNSVVKNVIVNNNNITAVGDASAVVASTAWYSSVCVAAGGSCYDNASFYNNTSSRGSGVIYKIDEESDTVYYITCHHVVDGYDKYYIMLPSQLKPVKAELVGYSSHYDIAVLKTDTSSIDSCTAIQVFNSAYITTGEDVYAVGNPLSGGPSVTKGIVSRINTMIKVEGNAFLSREIQIDAPINPGNSGGGAFNNEGKFIGLVNAKLTATQSGSSTVQVTGTAYAIPSTLVVSIADSMIENEGSPTCVNLGAEFTHNQAYGIERYNVGDNKYIDIYRVEVKKVSSGSIASGKLMYNDVIKSVEYIDIFGNTNTISMFNMYSFEDIKFVIKPHSVIKFVVDREFVGEKEVTIVASSFSTY